MVSYDPFDFTTTTSTAGSEPAGPSLHHETPLPSPLPVSYDQTPHICPCCIHQHEHEAAPAASLSRTPTSISTSTSLSPPSSPKQHHLKHQEAHLTLQGAHMISPPLSPPLSPSTLKSAAVARGAGFSIPPMQALVEELQEEERRADRKEARWERQEYEEEDIVRFDHDENILAHLLEFAMAGESAM